MNSESYFNRHRCVAISRRDEDLHSNIKLLYGLEEIFRAVYESQLENDRENYEKNWRN